MNVGLLHILPHLSVVDLLRVAAVNRDWRSHARANYFWRRHMFRVVETFPELVVLFRHWTRNQDEPYRMKTHTPHVGIWRVFAKQLLQFSSEANAIKLRGNTQRLIVQAMLSKSAYFCSAETTLNEFMFAHDIYCFCGRFRYCSNLGFVCVRCNMIVRSGLTAKIVKRNKQIYLVGVLSAGPIAQFCREFNEIINK